MFASEDVEDLERRAPQARGDVDEAIREVGLDFQIFLTRFDDRVAISERSTSDLRRRTQHAAGCRRGLATVVSRERACGCARRAHGAQDHVSHGGSTREAVQFDCAVSSDRRRRVCKGGGRGI